MAKENQIKTGQHDHTFLVLDGLRGVAAIAVMVFHYSLHFFDMHGEYKPWIRNAPFAVDFFFVLSGFVIAYAYEKRLLAGERISRFMLRRWIRLYPLYFLGMTLPLAVIAAQSLPAGKFIFPMSYPFNIFFLPAPPNVLTEHDYTPFPLNDPAWTLSLEIAVNLVYAFLCRWLTTQRLAGFLLLNATVLAIAIWHYGDPNMGWHWPNYLGGWARVMWAFFAGVLLYRLFHLKKPSSFSPWVGALLAAALLAALMCPHIGRAYGYFNYVIALPLIVWIGARTSIWEPARRVYSWLGQTSYAVYIIHMPLLPIYDLIFKGPHLASHAHASFAIVTCAILSLGIVWALDVAYDMPVRAWLTKKLVRR